MRGLAASAVALLALTGCAGEQGQRAQELLTRAQAAQARLTSMSYELRMTIRAEGQRATIVLDGAAYLKGRRAGDQIMTMRLDGLPGVGAMNMQLLVRGQRLTVNMNGRQFSTPLSASAKRQYEWSSALLDLTRYVKRVQVREGRVVNGEPGATVSGVIDTAGLLKAASRLQAFSQAAGRPAPDVSGLAEQIGDTRAALFISSRTGLVRSAFVTVTVEAPGGDVDLQVDYRLKNVNRAIPSL